MVTKANLLERRSRYDKYGAGVSGERVTDEYPTPLLFKEAQTPLNEEPPQVTSPGSVASGMSQEGQKEIVPPAVVTTDNPHAGMDNKDGGDMPERDNYHFYADLVDQYTKKPMTPEEEKRRKRSATAVEGIGHFGNVLNAFSNLVFTGQGAPSQELSKVPAGELQKFEDRVAENRRRYIGARMDADARDRSDWMNAWKMEYQRQKMADDAKLNKGKLDLLGAQTDAAKEKAEYQRLVNAGVPAKQAAELAYKNAQTETQKAMQYKNYQQGRNAYKTADSAMDDKGYYYTRGSKLTDNEAKQIAQDAGLNEKDLEDFEVGSEYNIRGIKTKPGKIDWQAAAAYVIQKGMLSREELEGRGFQYSGKRDPSREDDDSQQPTSKKKSVPGFGSNNQGKKKVSGF